MTFNPDKLAREWLDGKLRHGKRGTQSFDAFEKSVASLSALLRRVHEEALEEAGAVRILEWVRGVYELSKGGLGDTITLRTDGASFRSLFLAYEEHANPIRVRGKE